MIEYSFFLVLQVIQKIGRYLFEVGPSFLLSSEAYGEYAYLVSLGMLLGTVATLGTPLSLLRLVPDSLARGANEHLVGSATKLVLVTFFLVALPLMVWLPDKHSHAAALATIGFVLTYALTHCLSTFFRAQQRVKTWFFYQEMVQPLATVLVIGLAVPLVSRDAFSAAGILGVAVLIGAMATTAIFWQLRGHFPITIKGFSLTPLDRQVLVVSLPMFFTSFTYMLLARIDVILLERFIPRDVLGAYNIIVRTSLQVALLWQLLSSYYVPRIGKMFAEGNEEGAARLNRRFTGLSIVCTILLSVAFVAVVYGAGLQAHLPTWNDDLETAFFLVILGQLVAVCFSSYGYILLFIKKETLNYLNSAIVISINVGLNLLLIPILHATGAAIAALAALVAVKALEVGEVYFFKRKFYLR